MYTTTNVEMQTKPGLDGAQPGRNGSQIVVSDNDPEPCEGGLARGYPHPPPADRPDFPPNFIFRSSQVILGHLGGRNGDGTGAGPSLW